MLFYAAFVYRSFYPSSLFHAILRASSSHMPRCNAFLYNHIPFSPHDIPCHAAKGTCTATPFSNSFTPPLCSIPTGRKPLRSISLHRYAPPKPHEVTQARKSAAPVFAILAIKIPGRQCAHRGFVWYFEVYSTFLSAVSMGMRRMRRKSSSMTKRYPTSTNRNILA